MTLHIYVLHHKTLNMRKSICEQLEQKLRDSKMFQDQGIKLEYIEEHDPDTLDITKVRGLVDPNNTNIPLFDMLLRNLHIRQVSNALKHHEAYTRIQNLDEEKDMGLILEDDVIYGDSIDTKLHETMTHLREKYAEWDMNFLGLPQPLPEKSEDVKKITPTNTLYRLLPETSSYFIKPSAARVLAQKWFPLRFKTNIHLSYIILTSRDKEFRVTMSLPNLFVDGTKLGVYLSTLEANNKLILNQDYNKVVGKILTRQYKPEDIASIREIFKTAKFANHPDFQMMAGIFEMQQGNHAEAKAIFEKCYEIYTNNNSILNGESTFLLYYTRVFKHFQA